MKFSRLFIFVLVLATILSGGLPNYAQTADVRGAQHRLKELGYNAGPVDGLMGVRTRQALTAFQKHEGLPSTGELDTQTLQALIRRPPPTTLPPPQTPTKIALSSRSADGSWWYWIVVGLVLLVVWRIKTRLRANAGAAVAKKTAYKSADRRVKGTRSPPRAAVDTDDILDGISISVTMKPSPPQTAINAQSGDPYWVPSEKSATVRGIQIGGMVYVGSGLERSHYGHSENCLIDPSLSVAKQRPDVQGKNMPYWPSYSEIPPTCRLAYLQWLASGRDDPDCYIGYVFLYFYGLERRLFLDKPSTAERAALVAEVERLRGIYGSNGSFKHYSLALLESAALLEADAIDPAPIFETESYELPLSVKLSVGKRIAAGIPLDADWLLSWWMTHPESRPRMPARRAFPEFHELFKLRFADTYPEGFQVNPPKGSLKHVYRAASGSFERNFSKELSGWPDVSKLTKPPIIAGRIADECMDDLDAFSRYLGRNPNGRSTVEGHALLPPELAARLPNAELDELREWAEARIDGEQGLVPVDALLKRLEGKQPERVSRRSLASAAAALAHVSIGFAPDPNFALRLPKSDEPVQLFRMETHGGRMEPTSEDFQSALVAATLGTFIAHADGNVSKAERQHLIAHIDRWTGLSDSERERLRANIDWMTAVPPNLAPLRKHLGEMSDERKHHFGQLVIAVAGSDGRIDPAEISAIQKLYKILGLSDDSIYADLHALAADAGTKEPVTVRRATAAPTEYVIPPAPQEPAGVQGIQLDRDRVSAIMADTDKVSQVLGSIFVNDSPEEVDADEEATSEDPLVKGLDPAYRAFVAELLTRATWTTEEFAQLAAHFGLMAEGARETVNEWAYEQFDDALIEEDIDLYINAAVSESLRAPTGGTVSGTTHDQTA